MPSVYTRTLVRAAEILGGEVELAFRLQVTPSHLHLWMRGLSEPPRDVFLRAVDLVVEHDQGRKGAPASG